MRGPVLRTPFYQVPINGTPSQVPGAYLLAAGILIMIACCGYSSYSVPGIVIFNGVSYYYDSRMSRLKKTPETSLETTILVHAMLHFRLSHNIMGKLVLPITVPKSQVTVPVDSRLSNIIPLRNSIPIEVSSQKSRHTHNIIIQRSRISHDGSSSSLSPIPSSALYSALLYSILFLRSFHHLPFIWRHSSRCELSMSAEFACFSTFRFPAPRRTSRKSIEISPRWTIGRRSFALYVAYGSKIKRTRQCRWKIYKTI